MTRDEAVQLVSQLREDARVLRTMSKRWFGVSPIDRSGWFGCMLAQICDHFERGAARLMAEHNIKPPKEQ